MPAISKLGSLSLGAIILIALSLIALWLIVTGPLASLKNYADKNWNMFSPALAEPTKEELPQFKEGDSVWWFDKEYKGTGVVKAIDAQEKYYLYLVDFSTDPSQPATVWLVQDHLLPAKKSLFTQGDLVNWPEQKTIVLASTPNEQGIFDYKLMQLEPQPRIIHQLEKDLHLTKMHLTTTTGSISPGSIVWWQDQEKKRAGTVLRAHLLDTKTVYALKIIREGFTDFDLPETLYVQESDLRTPAYKYRDRVSWTLTKENLQSDTAKTGTGIIANQKPEWVEGYLYKIISEQKSDTEPQFLVPEENIKVLS